MPSIWVTKYVPDARSSNLKLAKKNLASIQLFIPLWMQGYSTFVYLWIFYGLNPSTHRFKDRPKKLSFFKFKLNQYNKLTNYVLHLRLTNCAHCARIKIFLYSHCLWLFCHLDLKNRTQLEDLWVAHFRFFIQKVFCRFLDNPWSGLRTCYPYIRWNP